MKKIFTAALALMLLFSFVQPAFAEETVGIQSFCVNPYGKEEDSMDTIAWYSTGGKYFLFLPADMDLGAAKVYFTASGDVTLDGDPLASGDFAAALTAGTHTLFCDDQTYALTVMRSANLPAVYITTQSGSLSYIHANKENKEPGNIRVYENGQMTVDKPLKQIKGRGNATWSRPKKPYNIKFEKKIDLFGMGKAKKWTLLANYLDLSLIHNVYGWEFAKAFGMPHTSEYVYVDLYINGDFKGSYAICESVEIGENRVNIADLEDANEEANPDVDFDTLSRGGTGKNNTVQQASVKGSRKWVEILTDPADVTGGYLLEYEYGSRYNPELCGFVTKQGQPVVIKSPEQASRAEVNYIADFVGAGSDAIYSETGYNAEGKYYSEYFDLDSLAAAYLTQELSMNFDAGFTSFFAYKPAGDQKVFFGPIWDMDNAFGSDETNLDVPLTTTNLWWANQMANLGLPTILAAANRHADFRALVREKWAQCLENNAFQTATNAVDALISSMRESAVMNGVRWNHFKTTNAATVETKWQQKLDISKNFVRDRLAEMGKGFGANGVYVYFDLNGVTYGSWATVTPISELGDTLTIRDIDGNGYMTVPEGKTFYCWNTKADGSGVNYRVGDTYALTKEENVFFAVWKTQEEIDAIEAAAAQLAADKAAFETQKEEALAAAGAKAQPEDSAASQKLIEDAKAEISALTYDETKTLEENIAAVEAILTALDPALTAQREADKPTEPATEPSGDGDSKTNWWAVLLSLLLSIVAFFRKVFKIGG